MSTTRRSLLTAAAAGALLGALSFVPSANATATPERAQSRSAAARDAGDAHLTNASYVMRASASSAADRAASAESADSTDSAASGLRAMSAASAADAETGSRAGAGADAIELADTGAFDTTPYVLGGTMFLCLGAGFVAYSVRRERMGL